MAPKHRNNQSSTSSSSTTTPAAVSPSANSSSIKPSTAASSQSHTTSTQRSSAGPTNTPTRSTFPSSSSKSSRSQSSSSSGPFSVQNWQNIAQQMWEKYDRETPQRTRMIDVFMGFLVVVGALQFLYCVLVGTYPFNAFLSGFGATIGQFVLTASLRMQTNAANKTTSAAAKDGFVQSDERAFADFVVGSLVLHFFCVNFVN